MFDNKYSQAVGDDRRQNFSVDNSVDEVAYGQMYTMPQKSAATHLTKNSKKKFPWWLVGLVVVLVVFLVGLLIYLKGNANRQLVDSTSGDLLSLDSDALATGDSARSEAAETTDSSSPAERDQQRLDDIVAIRSALNFYYQKNQAYPDILADLLDKYLEEIPINPNPGGASYVYVPQDNNQSYKLLFSLESGGRLGALQFSAGDFQATSELIEALSSDAESVEATDSSAAVELISGLDSDNDGLTDIEENLYQSDPALVDSDNDGYSDANELVNLYDPSQSEVKLLDSGSISEYVNANFGYSIFYPQAWTVRALTEDKSEVIFNSATTEFIQVMILDNTLGLGVADWYAQYAPNSQKNSWEEIIVDNVIGLRTANGRQTYFGLGSTIYAVIYNVGLTNQLNYEATYEMMLKSFRLATVLENSAATQRDAQRLSDVTKIRLALLEYQVAKSSLPEVIDADVDTYQMIGTGTDDCAVVWGDRATTAVCVDLTTALIPDYLEIIPYDPATGTEMISGYYLNLLTDGTLVVGSCQVEEASEIEVRN